MSKNIKAIFCLTAMLILSSVCSAFATGAATESEVSRAYQTGKSSFQAEMNNYISGDYAEIVSTVHPVDSVYITTENITTETMHERFGGTWVQIMDKFLYASSGATGIVAGSYTESLNANYLPSHNHTINSHKHTFNNNVDLAGHASNKYSWRKSGSDEADVRNAYTTSYDATASSAAGNSYAHNNMPPYYAVKMFRRVS